MLIAHARLKELVAAIFAAAGCPAAEAGRIAHYLVEANLVGHDSHGVIRVSSYLEWLRDGRVVAGQAPAVLFETASVVILDGRMGFGQVMGEEAMRRGIDRCRGQGLAAVALRNSGHLGRIGDWALMAADAGLVSLHFVNTSGGGILVAPSGGSQRRLSANPIAAAVPRPGKAPLLLDMSTCAIAEGKIRVALNRGESVPEGCLLDGEGAPTVDPRRFYANPPGAILPIGGHKGYGLGIIAEVLAGALTGGSCSDPANAGRVVNNMLALLLDPGLFREQGEMAAELDRFEAWVKSAALSTPDGEILMPGEPEERWKARRLVEGVEIDGRTWEQLAAAAASVGVRVGEADRGAGG